MRGAEKKGRGARGTPVALRAILVSVTFLVLVPITEEVYRHLIVATEVKQHLLNSQELHRYLTKFRNVYEDIGLYAAPGIILPSCSRWNYGCLDWEKFPKVERIFTQSASSEGGDVVLYRSCPELEQCEYLEKYETFLRFLSKEEAADFMQKYITEAYCYEKETYGAELLFHYDAEFCERLIKYRNQVVIAEFFVKVEQPLYARMFTDVWFRNELNLIVDFGRHLLTSNGSDVSVESLEAENE